ncbi:MAG: hypothetical protein DLM72_17165 [Candidatus Nitrosopolaris wilkensis]|nr:MAG: hypothetical protein DLM72_17165 [Candidatus Nitrosopolaris wilkensis]
MFFDDISEALFDEIPESTVVKCRVLLNIERFEIGQSYVTAKVQNRYDDKVTINIQGGRPGIELQESLFKIKDQDRGGSPHYAYLLTRLIQTKKVLVRKLPVIGMRDWLLIYEDTLVEPSVKDAYDELEIVVV